MNSSRLQRIWIFKSLQKVLKIETLLQFENDTNEKKLPGISYSKNLCIILSSENRKIFSMLAAQFSMIISISSKKCVSKESMIEAVA